MDDFIHGCQNRDGDSFWPLALWVTSPMDARGHYRWLHPWLPKLERKESLEHRTHSENWNQFSIWSKTTTWVSMGLKLTMPISNFKAGLFSMPTWFFDFNYPLRIILTSVVRKRKIGTKGNILKKRIPLSTIISRLGAPQSIDRFSTLQVILVDRCPVPSAAGWSAQPQNKCATKPDRTYFWIYFKSMAKNWCFFIANSWLLSKS